MRIFNSFRHGGSALDNRSKKQKLRLGSKNRGVEKITARKIVVERGAVSARQSSATEPSSLLQGKETVALSPFNASVSHRKLMKTSNTAFSVTPPPPSFVLLVI